ELRLTTALSSVQSRRGNSRLTQSPTTAISRAATRAANTTAKASPKGRASAQALHTVQTRATGATMITLNNIFAANISLTCTGNDLSNQRERPSRETETAEMDTVETIQLYAAVSSGAAAWESMGTAASSSRT